MNTLCFAIQTIPDTEAGRNIFDLGELDDKNAAKAMFHLQHQRTGSDILPHYLQRIIAISFIHRDGDYQLVQHTLGGDEISEALILLEFYKRVDKTRPILVSWPGIGNDVPVMSYRSLKNSVRANCFLNNNGQYHYIDLKSVFSNFNLDAAAPLDHIALLSGFAPCEALDKSTIWKMWLEGDCELIAQHTAKRALNTHQVYLRYLLVQGKLTMVQYEHELKRVTSGND